MSDPREIRGVDHLPSGSSQAGPPACQSLTVWLEVCAGTMPSDDAMLHLQHAAHCAECSSLLAQANAALGLEPTTEEQSVLDRLKSSSSAGQQRLAKLLCTQTSESREQPAPRRSWSFLVPIVSWGAAAASIIAIATVLMLRQPSDATLLAQAWNQRRPSHLRLPGTEPVDVASPIRGSNPINYPRQLRRLLDRADEEIDKPAAQQQTLGRIALAEGDSQQALTYFGNANSLDRQLPGINFDLASAYFELAETGDPNEYKVALNYYMRHLKQVGGNDPVVLYDLALSQELAGDFDGAIANFNAALMHEKDPRWRDDIETHLATLTRAKAQSYAPPPSPSDFLSSDDEPPGLFEQLLSLASRDWLPRRGTDPQIDAALYKLAALGHNSHHDDWLKDMLATRPSDAEHSADQALSEALVANAAGDTDKDLTASARAAELYHKLRNQPGYLRAAVEHLYALQRMGRSGDCLRESATLSGDIQLNHYPWLNIYFQLATSGAYGMLGDLRHFRLIAATAAKSASDNGLPVSLLRARGIVVYNDVLAKHNESAWREGAEALRSSQEVRGANLPRFQVLSNLIRSVGDLDLAWTRASLAEAAVAQATATINRRTSAYAFEELGLDDLQIGDLEGAQRSFHSADTRLASLGNGLAIQRVNADWTSDRALLLARTHGPAAGAAMLAAREPTVRQSEAFGPRMRFYTAYADLLRQSHNTDSSLQQILVAITDAERSLSAIHTPNDRSSWPLETRKAYEVLVADLAESNPALALRAWEWLQSAPFREGQPFPTTMSIGITPGELASILPPLPPSSSGRTTLVLARVVDHYILWSITADQQPIHQYILTATPDSILQRTTTFLRLCSDRRSSISDLATLGRSLYSDLLGPADLQLSQTRNVSLDVDPSLAALPFAALPHHAHYLGLDHALTFLPNSWVLQSSTDLAANRLPAHPSLAVLKESLLASKASIPADYDESSDIQRLFPDTRVERATLSRDGPEIALNGSADLGRVLAHVDVLHYVGHGLEDEVPTSGTGDSTYPIFKLSSGTLPHTRLAVLAACRTLREREDTAADVPSFAHIVMAAGATHVVATQWDVDSRMTSRLMQHFYAALAAGATFSEALRESQQSLQQDPTSSHPYFWSGFQLIGSS